MKFVKRVPKGAIDLGLNWYAHSYRTDKFLYHVHNIGNDDEYIERVIIRES